jgi:SNF2 family DNA or RNA helicase
MCRKPMAPTDLVALKSKKGEEKDVKDGKDGKKEVCDFFESKKDALEYLFTSKIKKDARILISSGPTGNFSEILQVTNKNKMTVRQLTGNIATKNKILEDFRKGTLNILYLPAYESGSGLNLIEVTDMILYHKMPNGIEDQVVGRCQRLGREKPLNLYKIYFENEIND